jgi:hypothetical protein
MLNFLPVRSDGVSASLLTTPQLNRIVFAIIVINTEKLFKVKGDFRE